mmetsp:Transcript_75607/g.244634  ORF Transcript_75607/g.244634 Transcript_75607/m.244634 type:complete len:333 (-) Transcript_75607:1-999(-)
MTRYDPQLVEVELAHPLLLIVGIESDGAIAVAVDARDLPSLASHELHTGRGVRHEVLPDDDVGVLLDLLCQAQPAEICLEDPLWLPVSSECDEGKTRLLLIHSQDLPTLALLDLHLLALRVVRHEVFLNHDERLLLDRLHMELLLGLFRQDLLSAPDDYRRALSSRTGWWPERHEVWIDGLLGSLLFHLLLLSTFLANFILFKGDLCVANLAKFWAADQYLADIANPVAVLVGCIEASVLVKQNPAFHEIEVVAMVQQLRDSLLHMLEFGTSRQRDPYLVASDGVANDHFDDLQLGYMLGQIGLCSPCHVLRRNVGQEDMVPASGFEPSAIA